MTASIAMPFSSAAICALAPNMLRGPVKSFMERDHAASLRGLHLGGAAESRCHEEHLDVLADAHRSNFSCCCVAKCAAMIARTKKQPGWGGNLEHIRLAAC